MTQYHIQVSRTRQINPYEPLTVSVDYMTQDIPLDKLDHEYHCLRDKIDQYITELALEEKYQRRISLLEDEITTLKKHLQEFQPDDDFSNDPDFGF